MSRPASPMSSKSNTSRSASRWPHLWGRGMILLILFALALLVYRSVVVQTSGIALFFDEAQYWDWAQNLAWGYYSKPPMIAGLIAASTALFGDSVLGVKLVVMALYAVTALCIVGFARALWPTSSGVRTGLVAGAVFMTIPAVGLLGLFATTDAPLILCWTLAGWMLWRAQVTDRIGYWAALGVVCGLGLLSKYTMAAFAITAIWALWGIHGPRRGLWRAGPWVAVIVAALVLSPNLIWNAQNGFPTLQHTAEITTQSSRSGGFSAALGFLAGQIAMIGPLAVVGAWWLRRRTHKATDAAPSSQMMTVPASQWAASSVMQAEGSSALPGDVNAPRPTAARSSPYYLAAHSSYRYLWALSLPLQIIAVVQAFHANAHVNWAAPSMVGFCLLLASRLSPPLARLSDPRPNGWVLAIILSNVLLASTVLHLRDLAGPQMPSKLDALVRMRGWDQAFANLKPAIKAPTTVGLPVLTDQRLLITHAAYQWRDENVRLLYWNPKGTNNNHYEMRHSLPDQVGADVIYVTSQAQPTAVLSRFATSRLMTSTKVSVGPDRDIQLYAYFLRGFLGYGPSTVEQANVNAP